MSRYRIGLAGIGLWFALTSLPSVAVEAGALAGPGFDAHRQPHACVELLDFSRLAVAAGERSVTASRDEGNVSVVEVSGAYDRGLSAPRAEVARSFYERHGDDYDFLIAFTTFEFPTGDALAFYNAIKNDVAGIGDAVYDHSQMMGSDGRLQGYIDMAALGRYDFNSRNPAFVSPLNTLAHEIMHRWGVQVRFRDADGSHSTALLGQDGAHWSLLADTDASVMYGARWEETAPGQFRITEARQRFGPWDMYLAGFAGADEVAPMRLLQGSALDPAGLPVVGTETGGSVRSIPLEAVIDAVGPRIPAADRAQRRFRAALLLLTRPGESVDPAVLVQLERFRLAFESYFQAITAGRASVAIGRLDAIAEAPAAAPLPLSGSAAPAPGDPLGAAVAWLAAHQQADGHWEDRPGTATRDTAVALTAIAQIDPAHPAIAAGQAWLAARSPRQADEAAWRMLGSDGAPSASDLAWLTPAQDTGIGLRPGWQPAVLDSALASRADAERGLLDDPARRRLADFLTLVQNPDGGFGHAIAGPSSARVSAFAARSLLRGESGTYQTAGAQARTWLLQHFDGQQAVTAGESAELLLQAGVLDLPGSLRASLVAGLLARQGNAGDWGGSVYMTAVSALGLALQSQPNYNLAMPEALPGTPVLGEPVTLRVRVRNNGGQAIPANTLQWFRHAAPGQGGEPIGAPYAVPALLAGEALTASVRVEASDIGTATVLVAAIDVDDAVVEASEHDNTTALDIAVAPPRDGVDAALYAGDVTLSAAAVTSLGQSVQVGGRVRNLGGQPIPSLQMALYRRTGAGRVLLAETAVAVPAAAPAPFSLAFHIAELAPHSLELVADPDDAIAEADETNNTMALSLPYGDGIDLVLGDQDLAVEPAQPVYGDDLRIRARVHNRGAGDSPSTQLALERLTDDAWERLLTLPMAVAAGVTSEHVFLWRPDRTGAHVLRIVADPGDTVAEMDETNNVAALTLEVADGDEPNLIVELGSIQFDPDPPREGRPLAVSATLRNLGRNAAEPFNTGLYLGDPRTGALRLAVARASEGLAGGAAMQIQFTVPDFPAWGDVALFVSADTDLEVVERNEDDNLGIRETTALKLGDLAVAPGGIQLEPSSPVFGAPVRATVEVSNVGEQPTGPVLAYLFERGPQGSAEVIPALTVPSLQPGAVHLLEWEWTFGQTPGADLLTASIDPDNLEREHEETNNEATLPLSTQSGDAFVSERYFSPNGDGVRDRTTAWFVLPPADISTVLVQDVRGYRVADLRDHFTAHADRVSATWDGRNDAGVVVPDGRYTLLAQRSNGGIAARVEVELDTDRPMALEAVHTDRALLRNLPASANPWQRPPEGSAGEEYVYAVGSQANEVESRKRGVFRSHVLMGGLEQVVSKRWLDRYALANDLTSIDVQELAFAPYSGELWLLMREQLGSTRRLSLWVQASLSTDNPRRVAEIPPEAGTAPAFLGAFDDERVVVGDAQSYQDRWVADFAAGSLTSLRRGSSDEMVMRVYAEGVVLGGTVPTTFVPADASQPLVDLNIDGPGSACLFRTQLQPAAPRLLVHQQRYGQEFVDLVDLRTGIRRRLVEVYPEGSACGGLSRNASPSEEPGAEAKAGSITSERGLQGQEHRSGYDIALLRAYWLETQNQLWVQDHKASLMRRFTADGEPLQTVPLPSTGLTGSYTDFGSYINPQRLAGEVVNPHYICSETITPPWRGLATQDRFERATFDWVAGQFYIAHGDAVLSHYPMGSSGSLYPSYCEGAVGFWRISLSGEAERQGGMTRWPLADPADRQRYPTAQVDAASGTILPPESWPQFIHVNGTALRRDGRIQRIDGGLTRPWPHASRVQRSWPSESRLELGDDPSDWSRINAVFSTLDRMSAVLRASSDGRAVHLSGLVTDRNFERFSIDYAKTDAPDDWLALIPATREEVLFDDFITWAPPEPGAYLFRLTVVDRAGNLVRRYASAEVYIGSPIVRLKQNHRAISPNGDGVQDALELTFDVVRATEQRFRVVDEAARVVFEQDLTYGEEELGPQIWAWSGRNNQGALVPDGRYRVELSSGFRINVLLDATLPTVIADIDPVYPPTGYSIDYCVDDYFGNNRSATLTALLQRRRIGEAEWVEWMRLGRCLDGSHGSAHLRRDDRLDYQYRVVASDTAGNVVVWNFPLPDELFSLIRIDWINHTEGWQAAPFETLDAGRIPNHHNRLYWHDPTLVFPGQVDILFSTNELVPADEVLLDISVVDEDVPDAPLDWRTSAIVKLQDMQESDREYMFEADLSQYENDLIAVRLRKRSSSGNHVISNAFKFRVGGISWGGGGGGGGSSFCASRIISISAALPREPLTDPRLSVSIGSGGASIILQALNSTSPYQFVVPESVALPANVVFSITDGSGRRYNASETVNPCQDYCVGCAGIDAKIYVDPLVSSDCGAGATNAVRVGVDFYPYSRNRDVRLKLHDPRYPVPGVVFEGSATAIPNNGLVVSTIDMPEGEVAIELEYMHLGSWGSVSTYFPVDHSPPSVGIFSPPEWERVCPNDDRVTEILGGVYSGTEVSYYFDIAQGLQEPLLYDRMEMWPVLGNCPLWGENRGWQCHMALLENGDIGLLENLSDHVDDGPATIRLRAYDWSGGLSCATVKVDVDYHVQFFEREPPRPRLDEAHLQRITVSANPTAEHRIARWFLQTREPLDIVGELYRTEIVDGRLAKVGMPLLHFASVSSVSGNFDPLWDAADSGLDDGIYAAVFTATDLCGNTKQIEYFLTLDSTPPVFDIIRPEEGAELRVAMVEVVGTVIDKFLERYEIAIGTSADGPWVQLNDGVSPVTNASVLAQWNTYGDVGVHFLKFSGVDVLGNRKEFLREFTLLERPVIMDGAGVRPVLFSPNGDDVLDISEVEIILRRAAFLDIAIADVNGTVLFTLANHLEAGQGAMRIPWDGHLASGVAPDGEYRVLIRALDTEIVGNVDELELTVGVDSTRPQLSSIEPSEAFGACDGVVAFEVHDLNLVQYDALLLDDAGNQIGGSAGNNVGNVDMLRLGTLTEAPYHLEIRALDAAGNRSEELRDFTLDCTPPAVALAAPEDGAIVAGVPGRSVDITGSVADANLLSWQLHAVPAANPSGAVLLAEGAEPPQEPLLHRWEPLVPDGDYRLRLTALDAAGNENMAELLVTVDGTPPVAIIDWPEEGEESQGVYLGGTATDAHFAEYRVDIATPADAAVGAWSTAFVGDTPVQESQLASFELAMQGEIRIRLVVTDAVGLEASAETGVIIDTLPPPVPIALAAQVEDGINVRLTWQGGDAPDLAGFRLYREANLLNDDPIPQRTALDPDVAEGVWNYVVTAIDRAGNESAPSNVATARVDRTPPDVAILRPGNGERVRGEVEVSGIAYSEDDFAWYELSLVDPGTGAAGLLRRGEAPVRNGLLHRWDTRAFAEDAPLRLRLVGSDRTGNTAQHEVQVIVDNLPPAAPTGLAATLQSPDVQVNWDPNTEPDLLGYLLYRNGSLVDFSGSLPADLRPLSIPENAYLDQEPPDGELIYRVYAIDLAGNVSPPSAPASVVRDETPPHVEIVQPQEGLVFDQAIEVAADSLERDIAQVRFAWRAAGETAWIDLGAPLAERPWRTTFDPEELDYGPYELTAVATDEGGRTDPQPQVVRIEYADLTPPAPPTGLVARADGSDVAAQWNANTEDDLAGYLLERLQPDGAWLRLDADPVPDLARTDAGRDLGAHVYRVLAQDTSGNVSTPSGESTAHVFVPTIEPEPYTPTADTATTLAGFGGSRAGETQIQIESPLGTHELAPGPVPAYGAFAFDAIGLDAGPNAIALRVLDAEGNRSLPATTWLTRGLLPEPPETVSGSVEDGTVTLNWSASPSSDVAGYRVYRGSTPLQDDAPLAQAMTASSYGSPEPSVIDGDPATVWHAQAAPLDDALDVALELQWPVPALVGTVRLHWLDAERSARDFDLEGWYDGRWNRIVAVRDNAGNLSLLRLTPAYPTDRLRLRLLRAQRYGGEVALAEIGVRERGFVAGTSHADTPPQGRHEYAVAALSTLGFEGARSSVWVAEIGDAQAPDAVVLSGMLDGRDAVLEWTESTAPDLSHYALHRDGAPIAQVAAGQPRSFRDAALPNGTHRYVVHAVDETGNLSAASNELELTLGGEVPGKPAILRVLSQIGEPALRIEWAAGAGPAPVSYRLFHSHDELGETDPYRLLAELPDTAYLHTGLAYGERVYYRVQALDGSGNASEWSDPVGGEVRNLSTPATPVLTWPTVAGRPVELLTSTYDVCGLTEPGTVVHLSINGVEAAREIPVVAANGLLGFQSENGGYSNSDWVITPDGRSLLTSSYVHSRRYSIDTGAEELIDPLLNGWRQLHINEMGTEIVGSTNSEIRTWTLTENYTRSFWGGISDISRFAMAPNKNALLALGYRQGVRGLWLYRPETGEVRQIPLADLYGVNDMAFAPDGRTVWIEYSYSLYQVDLDTLVPTAVLENVGLRRSVDVSPVDGGVLYVHVAPEANEVRVRSPDGTERLIATRSDAVYAAAWSPDQSRVALLMDGRVDVVNASDGSLERSVQLGGIYIDDYYRLRWSSSWRMLVYRPSSNQAYVVDPAGRFCARNLPAQPGVNRVDAVAERPSGVRSQRSAPIELHVSADPDLPDLSIAPEDIRFVPAAGEPGRDYNAIVTVRSHFPGISYHYGVTGRATLIAPDGSYRELPGFAQIGDFGYWLLVRAINVPLGTLDQPGDYRLQIELDPAQVVIESDENNNFAIATLHLAQAGSVELSLSADSTTAAPGTAFGGYVAVAGSTGFTGQLRLRVLDGEGAPVADLMQETAGPLQFAVPWSRRWTWLPAAGLFADTYMLEARLFDADGVLVESRTLPLQLEARSELRLHLQPAVASAAIGEPVAVQFGLDYPAGNQILVDATLRLSAVDAGGGETLLWQGGTGLLMPGYTLRRNATWATAAAAPGIAHLRLRVQSSGIDQAIEREVVLTQAPPVARLAGTLALAPSPSMVLGESAPRLVYRVENPGEVAFASAEARVVLREEGGSEALLTGEIQGALPIGGALQNDLALDPLPQRPQGYFAVLEARPAGGEWQALAQLGFAAVDGLAPRITPLSPDPSVPHRSPALLAADIVDQHSRVAAADYRIDGSAWRPLGLQGNRYEAVLAGLADGEHEIVIRAADVWGNERVAAPFRFVADSTPPQIVVEGVFDGQLSNQPLAPQVSVIDAHPDRLSVWLDGEPFASGGSIAADGSYTLTALAIDAAGNRSDAALAFTIDATPPPVAIVEPLDGTAVQDASIAVRVQTEALAQVVLTAGAWQSGLAADADGIALFEAVPLLPGANLLSAAASDAAGNESAPDQITVQRVHLDGELTGSVLPAGAEVARGSALEAAAALDNGTAQDHAALPLRVRALGASGVLDAYAATVALPSGGSLSQPFAFATAGWPLGAVTLELAVFLDDDWQVLDSANVAILDRQPPALTPLAPADGALSRTPVALRASAEDDDVLAGVSASLDGGPWLPLAAAPEPGQWQGEASPADGPHQIRFRAADASGNETVSTPTGFTVDATPPQIVVTGVADGGLYGTAVQAQVEVLDAHPGTLALTLNGAPYVNGAPIDVTGTYLLEATAEDAVGLTASRSLAFELDLEPPFVSIDTPADGAILMTAATPLGGNTKPFASVTVTGDASTHTVTADADGYYGVAAVDLLEGANTLRAVATDRLGRVSPETAITVYRSATALGLDGQLAATPALLPADADLELAYRIDERLGLERAALPLRLRVQRAGGAARGILFEQTVTVDLAAHGHAEGTATADSAGWSLGAHAAELAVEIEGAWHTLAAAGFDVIDATPPQAAFVEPAIDSYHATAAAVEVAASDAHGTVVAVEARAGIGGWIALVQSKPGQPWTGSLPSPGDGPATLQARAADNAGNVSAVAERPVRFDATPPQISITGVTDGELRNAPVTPVVAVEDASPTSATLVLDGVIWVSGSVVADDGEHLLHVAAVDAAGNTAKASVRFTIDTTPPVVVLTSPADGSILRSPAVDVTGFTEAQAAVELLAAGKPYAAQADAKGAFLVPRVALALGENEIAARATDAAGNTGDYTRITVERRGGALLRGSLDAPASQPRTVPFDIGVELVNEADEALSLDAVRVLAQLSDGSVAELDARALVLEPRGTAGYTVRAHPQGWPGGHVTLRLLAALDPEIQLASATVELTGEAEEFRPRLIPAIHPGWLMLTMLLLGLFARRALRRESRPC